MILKVGQKVLVREDLEQGKKYGGVTFNSNGDMDEYKGEIVTVIGVHPDSRLDSGYAYDIKEDGNSWFWSREMFIPVVKVGDTVVIKSKIDPYGYYTGAGYVPELREYQSRKFTVETVGAKGDVFSLRGTGWLWHGNMISDIIPAVQTKDFEYKVGDVVRIKEVLTESMETDACGLTEYMHDYCGHVGAITDIDEDGDAQIEGASWYRWTPAMLETIKYEVGKQYRFRKDLEQGKMYGGLTLNSSMAKLRGSIVTIKAVNSHHDGEYSVEFEGSEYYYSSEMLEAPTKFNVGDRVRVRRCKQGTNYGKDSVMFNSDMCKNIGRVFIVKKLCEYGYELADTNRWVYTDEMLEAVSDTAETVQPIAERIATLERELGIATRKLTEANKEIEELTEKIEKATEILDN